jgi:hypothetical protein
MMIEMIIGGAVMALNWFWSGSETQGGKIFLNNFSFMANEDSTEFVQIDDVYLPKSIKCNVLFRWINREVNPSKNLNEAVAKAKVQSIVGRVKDGDWNYGKPQALGKGEYRPEGKWDC